MALTVGSTIAHYEVTALIGEGGMGQVYRATDSTLGRTVAIKVLPEAFAGDAERLARFEREARAASSINHPNVAHIYEIGVADGVHYIAMELVEGETLAERAKGEPLEFGELLDVAIQITDALDEAHDHAVVHRDIKPGNVMIDRRGLVKVLDFGLAKFADAETASTAWDATTTAGTSPGVVLGTVQYMSPEQALGRDTDPRSDIFSLGALLYELATGRMAFAGPSPTETLQQLVNDDPAPIARFNEAVPAELQRIVRKCLEKKPEARYQSARELAVDLKTLKRDSGSVPEATVGQLGISRNRGWLYAGVAALVAAVAGGFAWVDSRSASSAIESVAVLPFENVSGDPDATYLAEGLAEAVINRLSRLPGLRVVSRSASFRYGGEQIEADLVGNELGVDALVMGRVLQRGDDLLVSAELVHAEDSDQLWGEQYQQQMTDLVSVQRDIAAEIAGTLRLELADADEMELSRRETGDADAYREYLRGRYYWARRTQDSLLRSVEHFERAVASDPEYALAYVGLADAYSMAAMYNAIPGQDAYPRARAAAEGALQLDPALAEAHTSLGWVHASFEWDLESAEAQFARGIELDPNSADALHWAGVAHFVGNRFEECLELMGRAMELEPLTQLYSSSYSLCLLADGQLKEAEEILTRTLELDPTYPLARGYLGLTYVLAGRYDEAITEYLKVPGFEGRYSVGALGYAYAVAGRESEARDVLARLDDLAAEMRVSPIEKAQVLTGLGDFDGAFEELERALEALTPELTFLPCEPMFRPLRQDPRFAALVDRMGV